MPQPTQHETLARGTLLDGRYRIERVIGSGGYASVYKALDLNHNVERAIKEVTDPDKGVREQFRLEADLLISHSHPNIPHGYYVFEMNKRIYFVMDFVGGKDLEELLNESLTQQHRPLDEARVLRWMIEICSALSVIHQLPKPIIHRDIKPANIKITLEDRPVLIDFGLAKVQQDASRAAATQVAAQGVSPGFAPPEQYMAKGRTDARTDVYGLGATLYACLTGKDPAEAPARLLAQTGVSHGSALEPPHMLNHRISPRTEAVILKALELAPSKRQQSAAELEQDLRDALSQFVSMTAGGDTLTMPQGAIPRPLQPVVPGATAQPMEQASVKRQVGAQGAKPPVGAAVAQITRSGIAARGGKQPPTLDPRAGKPQVAGMLAQQPTQITPVAQVAQVAQVTPGAPVAQAASAPGRASVAPAADPTQLRTLSAANGAGPRSSGKHPIGQPQQNGGQSGEQPLMAMTGSHMPVLQLRTPTGREAAVAGAAAGAVALGAGAAGIATAERERSGKVPRVSAKGAAVAVPAAAPATDSRAWIRFGATPVSGFGKWMLTLSAIEALWGAVALSLGIISIVNHGLPTPLLLKLGLGWLGVVVLLSLLGGQALSRPVYRRGALGGLRRGMQGTGLFFFSLLVHAVALWGATIFVASPGNELLAVIAYIIFGLNVLAAGALSVFNILD